MQQLHPIDGRAVAAVQVIDSNADTSGPAGIMPSSSRQARAMPRKTSGGMRLLSDTGLNNVIYRSSKTVPTTRLVAVKKVSQRARASLSSQHSKWHICRAIESHDDDQARGSGIG